MGGDAKRDEIEHSAFPTGGKITCKMKWTCLFLFRNRDIPPTAYADRPGPLLKNESGEEVKSSG